MRKPDPFEIVSVGLPVLIEAVAVTIIICAGLVWMIILATPVPA